VLFWCGSRRGGVNPRFRVFSVVSGVLPKPRCGDGKYTVPGTIRVLIHKLKLTFYRP
jgi:hypothetical protein